MPGTGGVARVGGSDLGPHVSYCGALHISSVDFGSRPPEALSVPRGTQSCVLLRCQDVLQIGNAFF